MVALTALVGTFLLAVLFYSVTVHIAARYVLGSVPISRAFLVGLVLAIISFALRSWGPVVVIPVMLSADFFAIRSVYRLKYRTSGLVALVHYTLGALFGITILNLVRLLGTAPT